MTLIRYRNSELVCRIGPSLPYTNGGLINFILYEPPRFTPTEDTWNAGGKQGSDALPMPSPIGMSVEVRPA
jgi:hypothetical protein